MNKKVLFNDGWEFAKSSLEANSHEGLTFEPVSLPHDWLIYNTLNLYENSIGWYRKKFHCCRGQSRILLYFDGVYMDSYLYVNGRLMGEWKYGYSSFEHDITDALIDGENEILVKVVHQSPNSRWYSGAGIYRNVWLKTRDADYIDTNGIYVSSKLTDDGWKVEIDTDLCVNRPARLSHVIRYGDEIIAKTEERIIPNINASDSISHPVLQKDEVLQINSVLQNYDSLLSNAVLQKDDSLLNNVALQKEDILYKDAGNFSSADKIFTNRQILYVKDPLLWSPDSPNLYQLTTVLEVAASLDDSCQNNDMVPVETITQNIGFRDIILDPDLGFIINGQRMKLNGVCEHHDLGALGAAFNEAALTRRFKLLKEMGVNAIRTAHNMPAPELMDLADRMGFLVLSEAFDMWERSKTTYDYARFFNEWAAKDIKSWITRDRNHPSVFLWSIGNEIYDTHADVNRGLEIIKWLKEQVELYDPKKNAQVTMASNFIPYENTQKCADILKIVGYNYAEKCYADHHKKYPDWVIFGSETASTVQSRGIYHFPLEQSIMSEDDEQCSSLGNCSTSWGAESTEKCIISDRDTPFSLGQFIWTGFDYIGEPTPYQTKNSYFGQLDTATFKKDSFYIYQAEWTDYRKKPMVHIFPYWDFSPGQLIDVRVCSNAPKVELWLNEKLVGVHEIDHEKGLKLVGSWKIPYVPGELKAIAYDEAGNVIATDIKKSFKDAKKIRLTPDKTILKANGKDIIFVEISMEDEDGNPVENANNRVFVSVTGAGKLIGLDNGNSTDYDQYKGTSRRLFSGKLMALIGSTFETGKISISVSSKGMETVSAEFEAIPAGDEDLTGVTAFTGNTELQIVTGHSDEIPLRKIELVTSGTGLKFDKDNKETYVQAILHPADTSYTDLEWSVVNVNGVPTNIAKVIPEGNKAKVIAMADGQFFLRCTSKNGDTHTRMISHLEASASGIGSAYKNPYELIYGCLYDYSKGKVGNGNEKGIAPGVDGETVVAYRNIDFGPYGSDKITLPLFTFNNEVYTIQIWEGIPGEDGSELLTEAVYQKETIWNIYQEETYILPRKLKGITTVSFVFKQWLHMKGFYFEKINRAFSQNFAKDNDNIYGDDYRVLENGFINIGNNISLEFNEMDFAEQGTSRITIYGKTYIDKNSIFIRFVNPEGEKRQLIEFNKSDDYEEQVFEIEKVTGTYQVSFIFLPGSKFDFGWFRFE